MRHGSLFSGIGGFDLAAEWMGWENVFHCEWDQDKQIDLKKNFPQSISYADITNTDFTIHRGCIDVLTGGFPCQDASIAKQDGKGQQGLQGARTGLFFQMCRAIEEIRPMYIVAENVSNILKTNGGRDFRAILTELARMGYNAEWRVCRASEVGAPHHRARLYLVAYANSLTKKPNKTFFSYVREEVSSFSWRPYGAPVQIVRGGAWNTEPPIPCVDDGLSSKLVRKQIHGYGNAIVPQLGQRIFQAIQDIYVAAKKLEVVEGELQEITPEQALHQAIQNDWQLNFLRSGLKCHLETREIKYLLTKDAAHQMTDPKTDDYQRLIQQRIDELTRHYLP